MWSRRRRKLAHQWTDNKLWLFVNRQNRLVSTALDCQLGQMQQRLRRLLHDQLQQLVLWVVWTSSTLRQQCNLNSYPQKSQYTCMILMIANNINRYFHRPIVPILYICRLNWRSLALNPIKYRPIWANTCSQTRISSYRGKRSHIILTNWPRLPITDRLLKILG